MAPNRTGTTSAGKPTMKRMLSDRWPTAAGIATMPVLMIIGILDDFAEGVVVAAVLYLAWGVLRRRPGQGGWVLWQVPGVLLFGAITVWALSLEHPQLQYALAVGWLGHAAWDVVHYRANRVVPRGGGRLVESENDRGFTMTPAGATMVTYPP